MADGSDDPSVLRARIAELEGEKMKAVARLASGLAHDFNNLLTAVMGHGALALDGLAEDDPVRSDIGEILRAGERGAELTKQLLVFGGRQVLRPEPVDCNEVVRGIEKLLGRLLGDRVELELDLSDEPCTVHADRSQLEQVLMNLAVNAHEAMPGGGTLTVTTSRVRFDEQGSARPAGLEASDYVRLEVRDTGRGTDPEQLSHVFEPYFSTKTEGGRAGLGLSSVHGIVTQSGGAVEMSSGQGEGTRVEIYLPTEGAAPPRAAAMRPSAIPGPGGETVLLAEDDAAVRTMVRKALEAKGYRVLEARDGVEALEIAEAHDGPLDLLLTDIVMPRMRGPALVAELARRDADLPVLYISGYPDEWGHLEACLAPEETMLQKPFSTEVLLAKVREILDADRTCLH